MNNNNTYTLENLPIEIGTNQFYCLCRRNGKIMIGNILGTSALTGYGLYEINGKQYKVFPSDTFKEDKYETVVGDRISCYLHYQDFVKAYYEHLEAKAKKSRLSQRQDTLLISLRLYADKQNQLPEDMTLKYSKIKKRLLNTQQRISPDSREDLKNITMNSMS